MSDVAGPEAQYDPEKTTREALRIANMLDEYHENKLYSNPAKNSKFSMHYNWHNNLVPENVVDLIASHETVAAGVLRAAYETLENTLEHRYFSDVVYDDDDVDDWLIGIVQELSRRDGLGAFSEIWARLNADIEGEVVAPYPSDEDKGIDIRTTETTYQVKSGESYKSNWEKKEADHLIWVKTEDNKIMGYEMNPDE
jgi:hypothetical protein